MRAYCNHFGVDWRCAAIELAQLGVTVDPEYLERRERTERDLIAFRKQRREQKQDNGLGTAYTPLDAWLDEDYPLHFQLCQEKYGSSDDETPQNPRSQTTDVIPF